MNFVNSAMWVVTGLYALQSGAYLLTANYPQALMVGAYSVANVGLIWSIK